MNLPYSDELEIKYLSRLFDNTTQSYKFFWFQAILNNVVTGKSVISYNEILNEMIADAWYMVTQYHLNLGPCDALESVINYIQGKSSIKPSEKKENIIEYLQKNTDSEIKKKKNILIRNVPYRLQASFVDKYKSRDWDVSKKQLIPRLNAENHLMYYYSAPKGLETTINICPKWSDYFQSNQEIIRGWLKYNMILYLQKRNPSVPGISDKLSLHADRNLGKVIKYWNMILDVYPLKEIYGQNDLTKINMSIDHFVPWSFVAHNEIWNLNPTTKNINSMKSNNLPDWKTYFSKFAELEYISYKMMWKYEIIHKEFRKCAEEHLNNNLIRQRVYKEGLSYRQFYDELNDVVYPVYQSAKNCGFKNWIYSGEQNGQTMLCYD